jgi:hypothetical protein
MLNAQKMKEVADLIKGELEGYGFALVVFDTGEGLRDFKYISNCERADMLATFEALVAKWKNEKPSNN